jgi:hypothetical protein
MNNYTTIISTNDHFMMKRLLVVIVAMLALSGLAFAQNVEV